MTREEWRVPIRIIDETEQRKRAEALHLSTLFRHLKACMDDPECKIWIVTQPILEEEIVRRARLGLIYSPLPDHVAMLLMEVTANGEN